MSEPLTITIDGVPRTVYELCCIINEHAALLELLRIVQVHQHEHAPVIDCLNAALDKCKELGL